MVLGVGGRCEMGEGYDDAVSEVFSLVGRPVLASLAASSSSASSRLHNN